MKRSLILAGLMALGTATLLSAQTGLTIYQDGRVLVRRILPLQLPQGVSSHRLTLGQTVDRHKTRVRQIPALFALQQPREQRHALGSMHVHQHVERV